MSLVDAAGLVLQLFFLEGMLSLDNAAVLGALASRLPVGSAVPWPRPLAFLTRPAQVVLGGQQTAALRAGLFGAVLGRGAMLYLAGLVITNVWIRVAGAAYLLYLAIRFFAGRCGGRSGGGSSGKDREAPGPKPGPHPGFWRTVLVIELADLAFSMDNVVASVALSPVFWITIAGVGLGMLATRFAAGLFARLISREPALEAGAYLLLVALGIELILAEITGLVLTEIQQFGISVSILLLAMLFARAPRIRAGLRL